MHDQSKFSPSRIYLYYLVCSGRQVSTFALNAETKLSCKQTCVFQLLLKLCDFYSVLKDILFHCSVFWWWFWNNVWSVNNSQKFSSARCSCLRTDFGNIGQLGWIKM